MRLAAAQTRWCVVPAAPSVCRGCCCCHTPKACAADSAALRDARGPLRATHSPPHAPSRMLCVRACARAPQEGSALARAVLDVLAGQARLTLATSHHAQLKAAADEDSRCAVVPPQPCAAATRRPPASDAATSGHMHAGGLGFRVFGFWV
jgi:hypothetical protein